MDYKIEKLVVNEKVVTPESPQVYVKKQICKDVDGTEYVRTQTHITREQLVAQIAVIQEQIDEIDALEA